MVYLAGKELVIPTPIDYSRERKLPFKMESYLDFMVILW